MLRLAFGLNICAHGAVRFGANYQKFIDSTAQQFAATPLPTWSVDLFSHSIPVLEFAVGLFLMLGLGTRYAAVVGNFVMMGLIFGMSILQNWEIVGIQMIYVLCYFLILFLNEYNDYSLDRRILK